MRAAVCDSCQLPLGTRNAWAGKLVNESLLELCSTLRLSEPMATFTVTPNVGDYSLATGLGQSNVAQIRDVFYQPVGQQQALPPLRRTSPSRIDEMRARASGAAYPWFWAMAGVDTLMLGPTPTDAGTLSFRYVGDGVVLSTDTDVPSTIPPEFHDVVWLLAATKLAVTRRPAAWEQLQKMYTARLDALRSWLVDLAGETPMVMQRTGLVIPNRDPSTYPSVY